LLIEVTEESNGVPFEIRAVGVYTRFVVEIHPEKRLFPDVCAHSAFEDVFLVTYF
jgi:hypothetical protein